MAKEKERQLAYYYYIEKQKTAKEVASLVGITERTMSGWVNQLGWRSQREAKALSPAARMDNIQGLISDLADQRIALGQELGEAIGDRDQKRIAELRRNMAAVDDGAAKWNKALENTIRDGRVRLTTYLDVMEQVFNAMREFDRELYLKTMNFQEQHILDVSDKIDRV